MSDDIVKAGVLLALALPWWVVFGCPRPRFRRQIRHCICGPVRTIERPSTDLGRPVTVRAQGRTCCGDHGKQGTDPACPAWTIDGIRYEVIDHSGGVTERFIGLGGMYDI